jgi:tyrosine-protein phosphatase SIW14
MASTTATATSWSADLAAQLSVLASENKSKTIANDQSQPPTPDGSGQPANFGVIAPSLYRASYPQHCHFEHLADLELKTIITLVPEPLPLEYANFISTNGINHHQIPILANKDADVYSDVETINRVLAIMLEPANYPLLLHCNKGKHRTGCMTACFRKVTGWPSEDCLEEYVKYSAPKSRDLDKAFIQRYDATALKPIALERGYVGGVYGPHLFSSTQSSTYSNATFETETTIASEKVVAAVGCVAKGEYANDYHEKAFRQTEADRESTRLWSHR